MTHDDMSTATRGSCGHAVACMNGPPKWCPVVQKGCSVQLKVRFVACNPDGNLKLGIQCRNSSIPKTPSLSFRGVLISGHNIRRCEFCESPLVGLVM
eukprot:scaffold133283_cov73-Phaeocystis_antarctica.AAC.2